MKKSNINGAPLPHLHNLLIISNLCLNRVHSSGDGNHTAFPVIRRETFLLYSFASRKSSRASRERTCSTGESIFMMIYYTNIYMIINNIILTDKIEKYVKRLFGTESVNLSNTDYTELHGFPLCETPCNPCSQKHRDQHT
jgi:hypothetical protein